MPANKSPDMTNWEIKDDGSLTKRAGYAYSGATYTDAINGMYRFNYGTSSSELLVSTIKDIYKTGSTHSVISTEDSTGWRFFSEFNDKCIITSATHNPLIYTGTGSAAALAFLTEGPGDTWVSNPTGIRFIGTVSHKQRVFGWTSGGYALYFSELGYYDRWRANGFINVEQFDNGGIVRVEPIFDTLAIYKSTGVWMFYGVDQTDFEVRRVVSDKSLAGPLALASSGNMHYFLDTKEGVFSFDGVTFSCLSADINEELVPLISSAACLFLDDMKLRVTAGGTTYAYNLITKSWERHVITPSPDMWLKDGADILFIDGTARVQKVGGVTDNGTAIVASYTTPYFDAGAPQVVKSFRYLQPDILMSGSGVSITYDIDRGKASGIYSFASSGSNLWGVIKWDVGKWETPTAESPVRSFPASAYGSAIGLVFASSGIDSGADVLGVSIDFKPKRTVW